MIVTICKYQPESNAKYYYKLCINTNKYNMVFQTSYYSELYYIMNDLEIDLSLASKISTKHHRNYYGVLECEQTIYYIEEGLHNGKIYT